MSHTFHLQVYSKRRDIPLTWTVSLPWRNTSRLKKVKLYWTLWCDIQIPLQDWRIYSPGCWESYQHPISSVSPCLCWREWTQSRLCSLPRAGRFCNVGIWRPECLGLTGENSGLFQLQSSNFPFPSSASFCSFPQVDTPRMSLINLHHINLDFRICFPGNQECRDCWQN